MSTISTIEFNLTTLKTYNETTQAFEDTTLTGNLYTVEGVTNVDGSPRRLSIGQLVMALCLERAVAKEKEIIDTMNSLNTTSSQLEALTTIETDVVAATDTSKVNLKNKTLTYNGSTYTYYAFLDEVVKLDVVPETACATDNEFVTSLERAMDERNSINQQTMIELQSATSKRDQAYDMISNILKSLGNVMSGILNNL